MQSIEKKAILFFIVAALISTKGLARENGSADLELRVLGITQSEGPEQCPEHNAILVNTAGEAAACQAFINVGEASRFAITLFNSAQIETQALSATLLPARVSNIVKFGNHYNHACVQPHMDVFLYGDDGRLLLESHNHASSLTAVSHDGWLAIAGPRRDQDRAPGHYLTLYSPDGSELTARPFAEGLFPSNLAVADQALPIAVALSDTERDRHGKSDVVLFGRDGSEAARLRDFTYINTLQFTDHHKLIVFSLRNLSLIDSKKGRIVWQTPEFYRLTGRFAASVSPDGSSSEL